MYTHTISRYEQYRDHDGNITSIFLAVNVSTKTDSTTLEHWLSTEERDAVLLDEANLQPILEQLYAEGQIKLENEIATRPMPTVFPLQEEGKKETLEAMVQVENVASLKSALVENLKPSPVEKLPAELIEP